MKPPHSFQTSPGYSINEFSGPYRFLSNFFSCSISMPDGITYPTTEHAYQAYKSLDMQIRRHIVSIPTPGKAKRFGSKVDLRHDWDTVRVEVMLTCLRLKFSQEPYKRMLLSTGDAQLIEGNHWGDKFWGVCNGHGLNVLGELLMQVRKELA